MRTKFSKYISFVLVILTTICFIISCSESKIEPPKPSFNQTELSLINGFNNFAFDLVNTHSNFKTEESWFISPFSFSTTLSMSTNIQDDNTGTVLKMLNLSSVDECNQINHKLIDKYLFNDKSISKSLGNMLANNTITQTQIDETANKAIKEYYYGEIYDCDFSKESSDEMIKSWIEKQTNGEIKLSGKIIDESWIRCYINAIYFNGKWKHPFDKDKTINSTFTHANNTESSIPMMKNKFTTVGIKTEKFSAATIPFGDGSYSLNAILLEENVPLNRETYTEIKKALAPCSLTLTIPKFITETAKEYNGLLKNTEIKHIAKIKVDEEGAVAAAVTMQGEVAATPTINIEINLNRPFYYTITDNDTGLIVFVGYFNGK